MTCLYLYKYNALLRLADLFFEVGVVFTTMKFRHPNFANKATAFCNA